MKPLSSVTYALAGHLLQEGWEVIEHSDVDHIWARETSLTVKEAGEDDLVFPALCSVHMQRKPAEDLFALSIQLTLVVKPEDETRAAAALALMEINAEYLVPGGYLLEIDQGPIFFRLIEEIPEDELIPEALPALAQRLMMRATTRVESTLPVIFGMLLTLEGFDEDAEDDDGTTSSSEFGEA
jgi:hypothetical protein